MQERARSLRSQTHGNDPRGIMGGIFAALRKKKLTGPDRSPEDIAKFLVRVIEGSQPVAAEQTYEAIVRAHLLVEGVPEAYAEQFAKYSVENKTGLLVFIKEAQQAAQAEEVLRSRALGRQPGKRSKIEASYSRSLKRHALEALVALSDEYPDGVPLAALEEEMRRRKQNVQRARLQATMVEAMKDRTVEQVIVSGSQMCYRVRDVT